MLAMLMALLWGRLVLAVPAEAAHCNGGGCVADVVASVESLDCQSDARDGLTTMTAVDFLQVHVDLSGANLPHVLQLPQLIGGSMVLACFLLVLNFAGTDTLVSVSIFLDLFMTTILTPLAPTLTSSYQLIALLTSSKNIVTCLIAPFAGRFIDGNEAKSMQYGMLCAMLCSLSLAVVTNYWFWLAVRCISGCSTAAVVWGGFALCNQAHADEAAARTKAMSMATAGLYVGVILGPQAGGLFVDDPRGLFSLLSAAQLCTFITLRFRLPDLSKRQTQMQKQSEDAVGMVRLAMDPDVRRPIIALFLALAFVAALGSTAFEYMVRLGYDQMKQNLTWLLSSVPAILFVYLVPGLRSLLEGLTLQILAMFLGGASSFLFVDSKYILLASTLLGASIAAGIVDANTPAMLADRSQERYGGTGQVFVLSNVADQAAFVLGPAGGSMICQRVSFPLMCQGFGGCMMLYALYLSSFSLWSTLWPEKSGEEACGNNPDNSVSST